jgi:hypothetical protein
MESQKMYELTLMTSSAPLQAVLGDQIDCFSSAVRQPRWILKQLWDTDLHVNVDKFDTLCTLTEYLEVLISNKPQSNRCRHICDVTAQKEG